MDPNNNHLPVCNNACWCLGEMAVAPPSQEIIKPFTDEVVRKLSDIYAKLRLNKSLAQNIAITLGRLGLIAPEAVAPHLGHIAKQWCVSLRFIKSSQATERNQAYKGFCYTIGHNTAGITKDFAYFCSAVVHYRDPPQKLKAIFKNMLQTFKQLTGEENWRNMINKYPDDLKMSLINRYDL
jgi:transportin-1